MGVPVVSLHVIGTGATELVRIGQVAMDDNATADYLAGTVFSYPTLAEAYEVAASVPRTACSS